MDRILVEFAGEESGEAEFTWGQREWWTDMLEEGSWWPLGGVVSVPPGRSLEDLAEELRWRMCRYPALRTRVRAAPDGHPMQVVSASGVIALGVIDAGLQDPGEVAATLNRQYETAPMDFEAEWPLRTGVVCQAGRPTHIVVLISHLVIDAAGLGVLVAETDARPDSVPGGLSPLEQAAWQASPLGRRQNTAALRYWETLLHRLSPHQFCNPDRVAEPRYWHGEFDSSVLLPAVQAISERTGVDAATAFLALFAVTVNQVHGVDPVVVRPMVDNRFRPGLADAVCTTAQNTICVLDVAGARFDEVLERARRSVLTAFKHAYVDPWDVADVVERVQAERGVHLDIHCFLNNRLRPGPLGGRAEADPRGAVEGSSFRWVCYLDKLPLKGLIAQLDHIPGGVRVTVRIDTAAVDPADAEALAWRLEANALAEAGKYVDDH